MDIRDVVLGSFGLPPDVALEMPRIMVLGGGEIFVENYQALAEYKKDCIRLITRLGMTEILGENFEILAMKDGNIAIKGKILAVRLI
jgi:sporulation protein YqfC